MSPGNDKRRPRPESGAQMSNDPDVVIVRRVDRVDTAQRCRWLRAVADELYQFDQSGQLSAQLLDLADLLEWADERRSA